MEQLEGGVAVVTGGGSGIGQGIVGACVEAGMRVVVADIDLDGAERVASAARESGVEAIAVQVDVSDRVAMDTLAERAYGEFGEVNLLCCNAGVIVETSIVDSTDADWEWLFRVNVMGAVHGAQAFVPRMRAQEGEAHIVNTSSMAGLTVPPVDVGVYAASKHAVVALTDRLRHELAEDGIGVSVLCPGRRREPALRGASPRPGGPRRQGHAGAAHRGPRPHVARARRQARARRRARRSLLGDHAPSRARARGRALRGTPRRLRLGAGASMSSPSDPVAAARREIEHLVYHYAELQDAADWDAISELFEHGDFVADSGVSWRGTEIAERRTANVRAYFDGTPRTRHLTTNLAIEVDLERGEASAESCYTILQGPPALPLQPIAAGRYIDRFEYVDGPGASATAAAPSTCSTASTPSATTTSRPKTPRSDPPPRPARAPGASTPSRRQLRRRAPSPQPSPPGEGAGSAHQRNRVLSGPLSPRERAEGEGERAQPAAFARQGAPGANTPSRRQVRWRAPSPAGVWGNPPIRLWLSPRRGGRIGAPTLSSPDRSPLLAGEGGG